MALQTESAASRGEAPVSAMGMAWIARLRQAEHPFAMLAELPADLPAQVSAWDAATLTAWRQALRHAWRHFPGDTDVMILRLADWAWLLEDWGLMRQALHAALDHFATEPVWLWGLAVCEAASGRLAQAMHWLAVLDELFPDHEPGKQLAVQLQPRHQAQQSLWHEVRDLQYLLCLEPLHADHADAFCWQYRDPAIAELVDLPFLPDVDAVLQWMELAQQQPGRQDYAVMHAEYGLIGVVSAHLDPAGCAFISFWLGCDHQGQGYAKPAVGMLLSQLQAVGATACFTASYQHNLRSQRTLLGLGFQLLNLPPRAGEDAKQDFFHLPLCDGGGNQLEQLQSLCAWLDSPLLLADEVVTELA